MFLNRAPGDDIAHPSIQQAKCKHIHLGRKKCELNSCQQSVSPCSICAVKQRLIAVGCQDAKRKEEMGRGELSASIEEEKEMITQHCLRVSK